MGYFFVYGMNTCGFCVLVWRLDGKVAGYFWLKSDRCSQFGTTKGENGTTNAKNGSINSKTGTTLPDFGTSGLLK